MVASSTSAEVVSCAPVAALVNLILTVSNLTCPSTSLLVVKSQSAGSTANGLTGTKVIASVVFVSLPWLFVATIVQVRFDVLLAGEVYVEAVAPVTLPPFNFHWYEKVG